MCLAVLLGRGEPHVRFSHKAKKEVREVRGLERVWGSVILDLLCCVYPGRRLWASGIIETDN